MGLYQINKQAATELHYSLLLLYEKKLNASNLFSVFKNHTVIERKIKGKK
jgi:hypothetical protein